MKKQYITPNTVSVTIKIQKLMTFASGSGDTRNGGGNKGDYVSGTQLSRDSQVWDDED